MSTSRGRRRRGMGASASGVGSGRPSVSVSAPYSVFFWWPRGLTRGDWIAEGQPSGGYTRGIPIDLAAVAAAGRTITLGARSPTRFGFSCTCVVCVGARVRGNLLLVVYCEYYGLPHAVVMLLAPRPVYGYGP